MTSENHSRNSAKKFGLIAQVLGEKRRTMDTQLPPTPPLHPALRHTVQILGWFAQGLANAERARRDRLTGTRDLSSADVLSAFLKENGIDVPRIDTAIRGLLNNRKTASAIREIASMVEATADNPPDLAHIVQKFAQGCAPATASETSAPHPAAAPPGTTWTPSRTGSAPARFRPDLTTAAREQARTPPITAPPAANEPIATVCDRVGTAGEPSTQVGTADCNEIAAVREEPVTAGPSPANEVRENPRLVALERELAAFKVFIQTEFESLRAWITTQTEELLRRVERCEARQSAMQAELERLQARVQQLEARLERSVTASEKQSVTENAAAAVVEQTSAVADASATATETPAAPTCTDHASESRDPVGPDQPRTDVAAPVVEQTSAAVDASATATETPSAPTCTEHVSESRDPVGPDEPRTDVAAPASIPAETPRTTPSPVPSPEPAQQATAGEPGTTPSEDARVEAALAELDVLKSTVVVGLKEIKTNIQNLQLPEQSP